MFIDITVGPNLTALLKGEPPPDLADEAAWQAPDFLPEEWGEGHSS